MGNERSSNTFREVVVHSLLKIPLFLELVNCVKRGYVVSIFGQRSIRSCGTAQRSNAKFALFLLIACISATTVKTYAQSNLSDQQLASALSVVSNLLLDGLLPAIPEPMGDRVDIALNTLDNNTYATSDSLYAVFEPQDEVTEFCFDLASNVPLQPGDLRVQINGVDVTFEVGNDNCFTFNSSNYAEINYIHFEVLNPAVEISITRFGLASTNQTEMTLTKLTRGGWNNAAVRKVINVFAFGGQALDEQVQQWADMDPSDAIAEMLNFDEHNLRLSAPTPCNAITPCENYTQVETEHGTLREFVNFFSDPDSVLPVPAEDRQYFSLYNYLFEESFLRMATVRGLNPFRQRIGFWETNYHLAVNLDVGVSSDQVTEYYDAIMQAHESGVPYHQVLGVAAKSAAAAIQYGHYQNQWNSFTQECDCNEDFAREIHQLYYGIFGDGDPDHENVTIPETAKMLTDMRVGEDGAPSNVVVFDTEYHHVGAVSIFGQSISGADASAKIDDLMPRSIMHPESLLNLPVMIISGLADDAMSESTRQKLRVAWASMGANKSFLDFIHAYAISTLFHSSNQTKYFTSFERGLFLANKFSLDNLEAYFNGGYYGGIAGYGVESIIGNELAGNVFRPIHNVFGGQNSAEASDSAGIFEHNFNMLTEESYRMREADICLDCDLGSSWEKKWQAFLPRREDGQFYVEDAARWLWRHIVGNLDHYTELERAHIVSILGAARNDPGQHWDQEHFLDFNLLMCAVRDLQLQQPNQAVSMQYLLSNGRWDNYCRYDNNGSTAFTTAELANLEHAYTANEIASDPLIQQLLNELGESTLPLITTSGSNGGYDLREHARQRINAAVAFIYTTPYVFAETNQ